MKVLSCTYMPFLVDQDLAEENKAATRKVPFNTGQSSSVTTF